MKGQPLEALERKTRCRSRWRFAFRLLAAVASDSDLWFAIISSCLVALLYRHAIGAAFVYDDVAQIQHNAALLSWRSAAQYARTAVPFNPNATLIWLLWVLCWRLWGFCLTSGVGQDR
jgi:hypothetical protein